LSWNCLSILANFTQIIDRLIIDKHTVLTDSELIDLVKESNGKIDLLYVKHKSYCINFMRKMINDDDLIQDIYHDAIITLYEKILQEDFQLTSSIQTYLNSICRNHILNRFKKIKIHVSHNDEYDESIKDWLHDDVEQIKESKLNSITQALEKIKKAGGNCYEILKRFYYENQSMDKIAKDLEYTNAANVKNQKARCQKKLNELALIDFEKTHVE
jgi:RNA polymerase sigma factor (sigma-70 family)